MAEWLLVFYVHIKYTHVVVIPISDNATHDSNELTYTTSIDQLLAN